MVSYTEQTSYRGRNRNRRVVVLEGTIEDGDSASDVPLTATNASITTVEHADVESPVFNDSVLASYNHSANQVEFYNDTMADNALNLSGETFRAKVVGLDE